MLNWDFVYAKRENCAYQQGNTQCIAAEVMLLSNKQTIKLQPPIHHRVNSVNSEIFARVLFS